MADPKITPGGGDFPAISEADELPGLVKQMARWEELQRKLSEGDRLTAGEYEEIVYLDNNLNTLMKERPELFNKVSSSLTTLEKSRGGTGVPGGLMDGSSSFANSFSERTKIDRSAQEQIKQTSVRYVDLPTPDEFLDDFENSYNIHITGLVQTGAISPAVAQFARENAGNVFGEYLREQTARLLKGEPLWRVVGQNADNKLIGRRTGEFSDTESDQTSQTRTGYNRSESETVTSQGGASAAPATEGAGGAAETAVGKAVESSGGTTSGTSVEDFTNREQTRFAQDEALVSRNRLGYVSSLAPLDFLKDSATAQRLNLLYGGQKGAAVREQQTAAGQTRVQARRV